MKLAIAFAIVISQLQLYNGNWTVKRADSPKPEQLKNECKAFDSYYACQQTVNGAPSALLVFTAAKEPGHYYTQSINTEGRALGRGELQIGGNRWVFTSTWDQGGKSTYYKTINTFSGRDHIQFEQQESTNGRDWVTRNSGDDTRQH